MSARPTGRRFQFTLLAVAAAMAAYARFMLGPLQESVRAALSLSDNQMALLQGPALALPMVIASIPLGLAIDRYSRARLLLIFAAVDLAGSLLTAAAPEFALLFLARSMVGLAVAAISATAFSLLADLYPPAARGRASMVVIVGQYGGMSAAFALGGALLAVPGRASPLLGIFRLGFAGATEPWRSAMLGLSAPLLVVLCLMLLLREPARTELVIRNPTARQSFSELWRYRSVIAPLLAGLVMAEMEILAVLSWAAPALSRRFALSTDRVGAIVAVALIVSGLFGPILGGLGADVCQRSGGPRRTMCLLGALAVLALPTSVFAVAPGVAWASALLVTSLMVLGAMLVAGIAVFTVVIPNELRGLCMSTLAGAQVLFGVALAPVAVSVLSGVLGGPAMIGIALSVVCLSINALAALVFLHGRRCYVRGSAEYPQNAGRGEGRCQEPQ